MRLIVVSVRCAVVSNTWQFVYLTPHVRLINANIMVLHILPLRPLQCLFTRTSFLFALSNFPTGRGVEGLGTSSYMYSYRLSQSGEINS